MKRKKRKTQINRQVHTVHYFTKKFLPKDKYLLGAGVYKIGKNFETL